MDALPAVPAVGELWGTHPRAWFSISLGLSPIPASLFVPASHPVAACVCRKLPKRVSTVAFTIDGAYMLAADKFGDVHVAATKHAGQAPSQCSAYCRQGQLPAARREGPLTVWQRAQGDKWSAWLRGAGQAFSSPLCWVQCPAGSCALLMCCCTLNRCCTVN